VCCLLFFNTMRGFDITDESAALLWAIQPEHGQAAISQYGYYTRLLYVLSGENIAFFRSLGLITLLSLAGFFSVALEKYWLSMFEPVSNARIKWEVIPFILLCTLTYYRTWLLTPSYNWLALCSIFLVAIGLLNAVAGGAKNIQPRGFDIGMMVAALLVGIGGGVAFLAKPTTALVLAATTIFWSTIHYKDLGKLWMPFLTCAAIVASLVLISHAFVFKGGVIPFYTSLLEGMKFGNILGGGHSIGALVFQAVDDIKQIPGHVYSLWSTGFLLFPFILIVVRWNGKSAQKTLVTYLFVLFLIIFFLVIFNQLWDIDQFRKKRMGFFGVAILSILVSSAVLTRLTQCRLEYSIAKKPFMRVVGLSLFLFMLAAAYAFGSSNGLVRQMSAAYVFLSAGALYMAYWIDQYIGRDIFGGMISAFIAISVLFVMLHAFNRPYRLPSSINEQSFEATFLEGNGSLYVDKQTAEYIQRLKDIAGLAGWEPRTPLIDLTGGSPGASVILGGRIMRTPWFLGGYKGSDEFAKKSLEMVPKAKQRSAWILTAPNGRRKISSTILTDLGLDFPGGYINVGKVKTGYRSETQILWKPLGGGIPINGVAL
jgi:hypothetical protein